MFEDYAKKGCLVKLVFNDDSEGRSQYQRGFKGHILEVDDSHIKFKSDRDVVLVIRIDRIISIREIGEGQ